MRCYGDVILDKKESLLSIVTSQRERFKQRNKQLESESQQQQQTISVLEREVDSLRCDNVKLYEKVRFLQTYPGSVSLDSLLTIINIIIIA